MQNYKMKNIVTKKMFYYANSQAFKKSTVLFVRLNSWEQKLFSKSLILITEIQYIFTLNKTKFNIYD